MPDFLAGFAAWDKDSQVYLRNKAKVPDCWQLPLAEVLYRSLADLEILNVQACVHHDVRRDGVEAPHMDPGISCPECEE